MAADGSFLVEDFLGAIASQLDRTQDALAVKALNRPLTYAIKDFFMELKVFVDMDGEGRVRFRSPGANEPGASSVKIGFTTITRPMIEENTVNVALTRAPTLSEAGLSNAERLSLERLGVRNTTELKRLGGSTGTAGLARLAGVPVDRLRAALTFGRPQVSDVRPAPPPKPPTPPPKAPPLPTPPVGRPPVNVPMPPPIPPRTTPPIRIPPATRRIEFLGRNLVGADGPPEVRLGGRPLSVAEADQDRVVVELPEGQVAAGTLQMDLGDGDVTTYELAAADPWAPDGT
jgi:hypothetical protein